MRCQKVRSCLSAYCRQELIGREVLAVREHLAACESCRAEEASLRTIFAGARELPGLATTSDFNTRLLNRLAQERFAETRTKAYLPRRAPRVLWRQVVPVLAGAVALAVVSVATFTPRERGLLDFGPMASRQLDDSYMTVQPDANPNMASGKLSPDWTLRDELARAERLSRISGMLASSNFQSVSPGYGRWNDQLPSHREALRMKPVIRILRPANTPQVTEARAIY